MHFECSFMIANLAICSIPSLVIEHQLSILVQISRRLSLTIVRCDSCRNEEVLLTRELEVLRMDSLGERGRDFDMTPVVQCHAFHIEEYQRDDNEDDGDAGSHVALVRGAQPLKVHLHRWPTCRELVVRAEFLAGFLYQHCSIKFVS